MSQERVKHLSLAILRILRDYSDDRHHIRQVDINTRLENAGIKVTRKTLHQKLLALQADGYPIIDDNGWYYEHEFCTAELDLLVNSLLFNTAIPYAQCQALIEKVAHLGGHYYAPAYGDGTNRPANPQFFYTLETLLEASEQKRQVIFNYSRYDIDKQLHPRLNENGEPYEYLVNPYRVIINNGRHYLIGNVDKYTNAAHFRIDRIENVRVTMHDAKPIHQVDEFRDGLNIAQYITEHVYMFTGEAHEVRIRTSRKLAGDILDWFGMSVSFENIQEDSMEAVFRCDDISLKYWLARYGGSAQLLTPEPDVTLPDTVIPPIEPPSATD